MQFLSDCKWIWRVVIFFPWMLKVLGLYSAIVNGPKCHQILSIFWGKYNIIIFEHQVFSHVWLMVSLIVPICNHCDQILTVHYASRQMTKPHNSYMTHSLCKYTHLYIKVLIEKLIGCPLTFSAAVLILHNHAKLVMNMLKQHKNR